MEKIKEIEDKPQDLESIIKSLESLYKADNVLENKNSFYDLIELAKPFFNNPSTENISIQSKVEQNFEEETEEDKRLKKNRNRLKELKNLFKDKYDKANRERKEQQKVSFLRKTDLVKELKDLLANEVTNVGKLFSDFYKIRDEWEHLGDVNKSNYKQLQQEYSHLRDVFYHNVRIYHDLKSYDFQKNAAAKKEVILNLKKIEKNKNIKELEIAIKDIQNTWDRIGPTEESIWESLKTEYWDLVNSIYDTIRAYYTTLKEEQEKNKEQKNNLLQKISSYQLPSLDKENHKEWMQVNDLINNFHSEWKGIGFAGKTVEKALWQEFKSLTTNLRKTKDEYFNKLKAKNTEANEVKSNLIAQAEALKTNTKWRETSEKFKTLQAEWKKSPRGSHKEDKKLWEKFRSHCDFFFNARNKAFEENKKTEQENYKEKAEISIEIEKAKSDHVLFDLIQKWHQVGFVPKNKLKESNKDYNNSINAALGRLKIDKNELDKRLFKAKLAGLKEQENSEEALKKERKLIKDKIDSLEQQIFRYEENIAFFGPSKGAQKLKESIEEKVHLAQKEIDQLKAKAKLLR